MRRLCTALVFSNLFISLQFKTNLSSGGIWHFQNKIRDVLFFYLQRHFPNSPHTLEMHSCTLYLGQTAEYLCQSQLCEQIANQTGGSVRQPGPALSLSSTDRTSVPRRRLLTRPRPASAVLDLWRPVPDRELHTHYSEVGSLPRLRHRPAATIMLHSPGQRRMAARSRPCSVIESSVTRETQSTELHHRVRIINNASIHTLYKKYTQSNHTILSNCLRLVLKKHESTMTEAHSSLNQLGDKNRASP